MASSDVKKSRAEGVSSLLNIAGKAADDLHSQTGRVIPNLNLVRNFGQTLLANGIVDDRKYLYEGIIQLAASLPNDSGLRDDLSGQFIKTLWNGLEHPPISYLGEQFKYRAADGSYNNIMYPQLGAAGSHYARSVVGQELRSAILPEPGVIFDTLLSRDGLAREHPTKISSHLFYFATIIIHDIFRTNDRDDTKLVSSSYLDLGPLYGHNQEMQDTVRSFQDGMLKKDAFAERRLLGQPPGVCALMIAFNRFHNYVVKELATINENGRFTMPAADSPGYEAALRKRDNDLFQTGRLITCGLYVNIILNDYLRTILNLNDNDIESNWRLDPREAFKNVFDSEGTPKGIGNQVSAEFNFIYRWHCATSNEDEAWLNDFMIKIFGKDVDPSTLDTADFRAGLYKWFQQTVPKDPGQWTFGDLTRGEDGSFQDVDLVQLLKAGTDNVAGAYGARNIPPALKAIEILGIEQGRRWGLASLNEFREFFNLKPFSTFKDINSQPGIAEALEALYGEPKNVELYPGLMAEEAKKPFSPGSGLCPGFTISEAILSDAVALVRGDRFYSVEYGPQSLTGFGFKEASSDFDVAGGGVMYKLLMRAFPGWYRANSAYALYPFNTPERTRAVFAKKPPHNIELNYDPPMFVGPPVPVITWKGVVDILHDQQRFKVPWGEHTYQLTGHDYMLSGDKPSNTEQRREVQEAMYRPADTLVEVRKFYETVTQDLIRKNKRKMGNVYQIDIVKDIGNLAHAIFTAKYFDIPLRDDKSTNTKSGYTAKEIYDVLAHLFEYVFLDLDTAKSYKHRVVATRDTQQLAEVMRKAVESANRSPGLFQMIMDFLTPTSGPPLPGFGKELVSRLLERGKSIEEIVWELIPTQAAAAATQGQAWAQLIDVYMSDEYKHHWPAIVELAKSDAPDAFEKLKKYALEGFRLFPAASGVLRVNPSATTIPSPDPSTPNTSIPLPANSQIFLDFITASLDPAKFPDPTSIRLDRPEESYIHHGWGPHACLGRPIVTTAGAAMLRIFARECPGARRAPGAQGQMQRKLFNGAFPVFLAEDGGSWESFPVQKKVVFDVEVVPGVANGHVGGRRNGAPVGNGHVDGVRG